MLTWTVFFLIMSVIAGFFGFGGVAVLSAEVAQILFFLFVVLFVGSLLMKVASKGDQAIN